LPVLAISLGQIGSILTAHSLLKLRQYLALAIYLSIIVATLFLFYVQDIKNGMAHATLCVALFTILLFFSYHGQWWRKALVALALMGILVVALYPHVQKNQTWKALIADTKVAFQIDKYPQWKYVGQQSYPNNEFGDSVSGTTYDRAAWFKVGVGLALHTPLGYGLIEDSFKKMAKYNWPEVSDNLSHSHSGWLDVILAVGFPGFFCVLGALVVAIRQSSIVLNPWKALTFWSLVANLMLWMTTEVSATVSFATLIFWIGWSGGMTLFRSDPIMPPT
jgi:O-antigen ligase